MEQNKIEAYLENHEYITLGITKEELLTTGGKRYFALLKTVGEQPAYADKFCGKLFLNFKDYGEELWHSPEAQAFVHELVQRFPYLFFLAEKENATLKLITILECSTGVSNREDMALDKEKFNGFLQSQLKGLVLMSQHLGYSPEHAQSLINDIYAYFGI